MMRFDQSDEGGGGGRMPRPGRFGYGPPQATAGSLGMPGPADGQEPMQGFRSRRKLFGPIANRFMAGMRGQDPGPVAMPMQAPALQGDPSGQPPAPGQNLFADGAQRPDPRRLMAMRRGGGMPGAMTMRRGMLD